MPTIAEYADERLREFLDAAHDEIKFALWQQHGQEWLDQGVRKHFPPDYFRLVEEVLANAMRVVDMDKEPEELYGVEHLWNIINGNPAAFPKLHGSPVAKRRGQEYLEEISELRHNLAHRRTRHILPKRNLIRAMDNCARVLESLGSAKANFFEDIHDSLTSGMNPWGQQPLDGQIPPSDEIYTEFVGRRGHLHSVSNWLFETDHPQHLVWGYGGSGKSALAYKFVHDVKEGGNSKLLAACWVSAKKEEFYSGIARKRHEDFDDLNTFVRAVWASLYDDNYQPKPEDLIKDLKETPILLVVDDFDTVASDADLSEYILYNLRNTAARVLLTSRHRDPASGTRKQLRSMTTNSKSLSSCVPKNTTPILNNASICSTGSKR